MRHKGFARAKKIVLSAIAGIALALGLIGIALPILPTTPFVILAAALYSVSDPERAKKLENSRIFGEYLRHWKTREGIPLKTKVRAIIFIWAGLFLSMFIAKSGVVYIILSVIGVIVSLHLIFIKTKKGEEDEILKPQTADH